jgi:hypothetical protein
MLPLSCDHILQVSAKKMNIPFATDSGDCFDYKVIPFPTPQELDDAYAKHATRYHAYWIRIYGQPLAHTELQRLRAAAATDAEKSDVYGQLSREELAVLYPHMIGLEIIRHHHDNDTSHTQSNGGIVLRQGNTTHGIVVGAMQQARDGAVDLLIRPYECLEGRWLVYLLEGKVFNGFSLQHVRIADVVQLREISICVKGLRPQSVLLAIVSLPLSTPALTRTSQVYRHPANDLEKLVCCASAERAA